MPKSINQLQAELLSSGVLDKLGASQQDFASLGTLPVLEQYLILAAANFIQKVKDNIEVLGISDTGSLSDDISSGELVKESNGYSIEVGYPRGSKAAKYYDFVNKGVKGFDTSSNRNSTSPYSFKNIRNKKGGVLIGGAMLKNISSWVDRNGIRRNDVAITRRQATRQSLSNMVSEASRSKNLAYAVAVNIKKRGLRKTGFFDSAVDSYFGRDFAVSVSKIIGQDIKVLIRQNGNNNQ
jgi:hypothetical protein